ncbi:MAG: efflux RND transporter periplasmic adaptor subunit [Bryobacteraceae bacterium]|nr:efflux RND transporter periplasmic adaptor subunit [Bryobacteraceae bacterium]
MRSNVAKTCVLLACVPSLLLLSGCGGARADTRAEAPPPARVVPAFDVSVFSVEHPEQFPIAASTAETTAPELVVTGTVAPDISRNVPVISLASGRVVAVHARLGDTVKKGQLLLTVRSDDVSGAFSNYRKAMADEVLARTQLTRAKELYAHGAIALNDLQVAQDTEDKAVVDVETMSEHIRLLGNNPDHPNGAVDIFAPVSGIITDQQVTNSAGVQSLSTNPFTISDLTNVWIVCDVYENDLPNVHLGDSAEIRLNAYPDRVLKGSVSNIAAALDPNIRTAKVRIEVGNPGTLRMGMFVTATFRSRTKEVRTVVPASAVLHLHDRDWVYVPAEDKKFHRVEVVSGDRLPGNLQQIKSGLEAGQQVVANAVVLDHAIAINQ